MEVFSKNEVHLKQNKSDTKARQNRRELFTKIVKCHFDIENDVLALSNSSVSDYLVSWTSESSETVTDDDIKYLMSARNDPTVWAEGLEPTYQIPISSVRFKIGLHTFNFIKHHGFNKISISLVYKIS